MMKERLMLLTQSCGCSGKKNRGKRFINVLYRLNSNINLKGLKLNLVTLVFHAWLPVTAINNRQTERFSAARTPSKFGLSSC